MFVMATRAVRVVSGGEDEAPPVPGLQGLPEQLGGGLAEGGSTLSLPRSVRVQEGWTQKSQFYHIKRGACIDHSNAKMLLGFDRHQLKCRNLTSNFYKYV